MKTYIIFPKKFFSAEQLGRLAEHEVNFIEGDNIDLEALPDLFAGGGAISWPLIQLT